MMYWLAKAFQAAGLGVMALGFIQSYPNMMSRTALILSVAFFAVGWVIQAYMLKK